MNYFPRANAYLTEHLGYHLDPAHADDFRGYLARIGWKRFVLAVEKVKPWDNKAQATHQHLLRVMRHMTPPKRPGTKYRNPLVSHALEASHALEERLGELLANPRQ